MRTSSLTLSTVHGFEQKHNSGFLSASFLLNLESEFDRSPVGLQERASFCANTLFTTIKRIIKNMKFFVTHCEFL